MKIALISDIHANLPAFEAVLEDIRVEGADQIVFLGDAATLGPHPRETLDLLRALDCVCIMGNHDAALLDLERASELQIAPPLHATLQWGRDLLNQAHLDFLRSFISIYKLNLGSISLLCFHGSPRSNVEMILSTTPEPRMGEYFAGFSNDALAGGHTHIQMIRQRGRQIVINPGSVGNAFVEPFLYGNDAPTLLPWAGYAIVHVERGGWSVDLRRIPFNTEAVIQAVISDKMPNKERWLGQYK